MGLYVLFFATSCEPIIISKYKGFFKVLIKQSYILNYLRVKNNSICGVYSLKRRRETDATRQHVLLTVEAQRLTEKFIIRCSTLVYLKISIIKIFIDRIFHKTCDVMGSNSENHLYQVYWLSCRKAIKDLSHLTTELDKTHLLRNTKLFEICYFFQNIFKHV